MGLAVQVASAQDPNPKMHAIHDAYLRNHPEVEIALEAKNQAEANYTFLLQAYQNAARSSTDADFIRQKNDEAWNAKQLFEAANNKWIALNRLVPPARTGNEPSRMYGETDEQYTKRCVYYHVPGYYP
jgi:hypothetical protein